MKKDKKFEEYDFDPRNLRLLYLRVKLQGYDVAVDLAAPEDASFEDLHLVLNSVLQRDNAHLFRFECADGCIAVCPNEETDEENITMADRCYLGHHLTQEKGADYVYDYGDNWEHEITVEKIAKVATDNCHFQLLQVTGEIPEQYPDRDEE